MFEPRPALIRMARQRQLPDVLARRERITVEGDLYTPLLVQSATE